MRIRSVKYPKLLTVELDGRAITKATKTRDIEGNRWTKQELTNVRKEFTWYCEHVIGLAIKQGDQVRPWLDENLEEISQNWDHYAKFWADIIGNTMCLRCKVDIDGNPDNYVRLLANVDLSALEQRANKGK